MSGQRWLLPFQFATGMSALQQTHLLWLQGKVNLEGKDCNQLGWSCLRNGCAPKPKLNVQLPEQRRSFRSY